MAFLGQSGPLEQFVEVVPGSLSFTAPERASIVTGRRQVRSVPQTGMNSGPNAQIQFLIGDNAGLLDPRSIRINYNVQTSGGGLPVTDDGHCFQTCQVLLNGAVLDNVNNAMKATNAECALGMSKSYYETAGSFQGFELLNGDLNSLNPGTGVPVAGSALSYGFVAGNLTAQNLRQARVGAALTNNVAGESRSIPLGLISGVGRINQYLPISLLGEISVILTTGSATDVLVNSTNAAADQNYQLFNISIEYDIISVDTRYFNLLKKLASEDAGITMAYESTIVSTGGAIAVSANLTENTLIVSRGTSNLIRCATVFIPTAGLVSANFPSQSCFGHAGVHSVQHRISSMVYPSMPAQGDSALFNMSLCAYGSGSITSEHGSIINRCLYGNATSPASAGTQSLVVFETADAATGGSTKFAYADRFVAAYGFKALKGMDAGAMIDGVSLSSGSGSQLVVAVVQAPAVAYTAFVVTVATRFIQARQGAVTVMGA